MAENYLSYAFETGLWEGSDGLDAARTRDLYKVFFYFLGRAVDDAVSNTSSLPTEQVLLGGAEQLCGDYDMDGEVLAGDMANSAARLLGIVRRLGTEIAADFEGTPEQISALLGSCSIPGAEIPVE